jgi:hypothetical protein
LPILERPASATGNEDNEDVARHEKARSGRRPSRAVLGGSIIAIVVILFVAWQSAAAASARAIIVTTDARPLICAKGQEFTTKVAGRYIEMARLMPALDCTLRVRIYNDGIFPVHIDAATYSLLGARGVTAHIGIIDGQPSSKSNRGIDATGDLQNGDLPPGGEFTLVAHISASGLTCYSDGSSVWWSNESPILSLTILGTSQSREPSDVRFGFEGTKQSASGC